MVANYITDMLSPKLRRQAWDFMFKHSNDFSYNDYVRLTSKLMASKNKNEFFEIVYEIKKLYEENTQVNNIIK